MPALVELAPLVLLIVALALAMMSQAFVEALLSALGGILGRIPGIGGALSAPVHAVARRFNGVMSRVVVGLEAGVAASWHVLAQTIAAGAHLLVEMAQATGRVAWLVEVKFPLHVLSETVDALERGARLAGKVARSHPGPTKVIGVAAFLPSLLWLRSHLGALKHAIAVPVPHVPAIPRVHVPALPRDLVNIRKRLKALEAKHARGAFTAAVAVALGTLGLSWTRRTCARRNAEKLCKVDPAWLDGLLLGGVALGSLLSVQTFARELQAIEGEVAGLIFKGVRETRGLRLGG